MSTFIKANCFVLIFSWLAIYYIVKHHHHRAHTYIMWRLNYLWRGLFRETAPPRIQVDDFWAIKKSELRIRVTSARRRQPQRGQREKRDADDLYLFY